MEPRGRNKIIVILGPTSSGKSSLAIRLAQEFEGEIVSADSRQVYRGLDVGTGKVTKKEQSLVKHHLLDVATPHANFDVVRFKKKAEQAIREILKRGKIPIICGGTGFWIKALVDNVVYPEVKPNPAIRKKLAQKTEQELFILLKKKDPRRAKNIDPQNKIRLIRALEICATLGTVPPIKKTTKTQAYQFLQIGICLSKEKLHRNIEKRLRQRFADGMIEEVKKLRNEKKLSWKKLENFGLGYLWIAKQLQRQLPKEQLFDKVFQAEKNYAKRQLTWFRKDKRIIWQEKYPEIKKKVKAFLAC